MDGEISPAEVATLLENDADVRVVDIRDAETFERGRIPDSENVPFHDLPGRIEEFADAARVVTVCPHGKASVQAARLIGSYEGSAAATVESMKGGLEAWAETYDLSTGAVGDGLERDGIESDGTSDSGTDADHSSSSAPF